MLSLTDLYGFPNLLIFSVKLWSFVIIMFSSGCDCWICLISGQGGQSPEFKPEFEGLSSCSKFPNLIKIDFWTVKTDFWLFNDLVNSNRKLWILLSKVSW